MNSLDVVNSLETHLKNLKIQSIMKFALGIKVDITTKWVQGIYKNIYCVISEHFSTNVV